MSPQIERQREIIDRRAISAALDALAEDAPEPPRAKVAEVLRRALQQAGASMPAPPVPWSCAG
jgi:hypothetical protein